MSVLIRVQVACLLTLCLLCTDAVEYRRRWQTKKLGIWQSDKKGVRIMIGDMNDLDFGRTVFGFRKLRHRAGS
ncbi:hypothetical protein B0T20DRAFT_26600 [Sordaria brevicollis]|uniref:Secreted protein n=1 Tax=Sordaria brevicollis TaxID=83679 RepID=A0AAE0UH38_SORBR|nr:hypothetical protein B0T20DRAFT_26600 [Sordaria brevicollis]